jgi:formylglycine-generating enzyme required for sulfatase activity
MGSTDDKFPLEKPQHLNETITQSYFISRFPITNAQYAAFVKTGSYQKQRYWTGAGWEQKERRGWTGPDNTREAFNLPNHPVVGVSWYEAVAFCHWLTEQLHQSRELGTDKEITLPTEPQWEKAARGMDGRIYPWGNDPDPNRANYGDTGIGMTSAIGCFPGGSSSYEVEDLSGNVWEWCLTKWEGSYKNYQNDNNLEGKDLRVMRGGAFDYYQWSTRCAFRASESPDKRYSNRGFRVVISFISPQDSDPSEL